MRNVNHTRMLAAYPAFVADDTLNRGPVDSPHGKDKDHELPQLVHMDYAFPVLSLIHI